jgi:L-threonylcarbamoyladenylate synthase
VSSADVVRAIATLRAGGLAIVPTDTVYGLAADGDDEAAARVLYAAKGRAAVQPTALVLASVEELVARVPELPLEALRVARALLPGRFTLVLPNPRRRYAWLNAERPEAIGIRVPAAKGPGGDVLAALGALVATSANLPGGPDPRRLDDVPRELVAAVGAVVDGGELPGTPSTVIDVTGPEPRLLRKGAVPAGEALARAAAALTDR